MDISDPDSLNGKSIIVGITYCDADGNVENYIQHYGILRIEQGVISVRATHESQTWPTMVVERDGRELLRLPYDKWSLRAAQKGTYKLKETGEEIEDPDLLSMWTINRPRSQ